MAANQLRLWFSSFAYVLLTGLRRIRGQFTMTFNGQFVICF